MKIFQAPVGGHLDAAASTNRVEHLEERLNKVPFWVGKDCREESWIETYTNWGAYQL